MPNPARPTSKNDRRRAARERAREAMATQRRQARRRSVLIRSGVAAGVVAAVAVVAVVLVSGIAPAVAGPRNLAGDGIRIGAGLVADRSPALEPGAAGAMPVDSDDAVSIRVYSDFHCPSCGEFERENGAYLEGLVEKGTATVEYHPIAIVDRLSQGAKYSTRAAAAALCVADLAPDSYFAANAALFAKQPAPQTPGLSTDEIGEVVIAAVEKATAAEVTACVADQRFAGWVGDLTKRVAANVTGSSDADEFRGTPTVIIDGSHWDSSKHTLKQAVLAAVTP